MHVPVVHYQTSTVRSETPLLQSGGTYLSNS